ncbi:MAG: hypothetical protein JNL58_23750 [Planctomyces sp.]|nr:hypothetical protein [Planctomyces sp.]
MKPLNPHLELLGRLINASEERQKVISQNVANVNTPHYQRLEYNFEQQLARELSKGTEDFSGVSAEVRRTPGLPARADGNNVDIDREIGEMNKNAILQQTYLQLLGHEISQMRLAIEGS